MDAAKDDDAVRDDEWGKRTRLREEERALRRAFEEPGLYEVRTPCGARIRIFVVSRHPWRFARAR
jgi:hypothetical protein